MKFNRLRYFVKIAEEGNLHRAAEQLRIAQPALTRHIMQLEEELGVLLLNRMPRGVRLTEAGEALYRGAKKILSDLDELLDSIKSESESAGGVLSVAFEDTVSQNPILAAAVQCMKKTYPKSLSTCYH